MQDPAWHMVRRRLYGSKPARYMSAALGYLRVLCFYRGPGRPPFEKMNQNTTWEAAKTAVQSVLTTRTSEPLVS